MIRHEGFHFQGLPPLIIQPEYYIIRERSDLHAPGGDVVGAPGNTGEEGCPLEPN